MLSLIYLCIKKRKPAGMQQTGLVCEGYDSGNYLFYNTMKKFKKNSDIDIFNKGGIAAWSVSSHFIIQQNLTNFNIF